MGTEYEGECKKNLMIHFTEKTAASFYTTWSFRVAFIVRVLQQLRIMSLEHVAKSQSASSIDMNDPTEVLIRWSKMYLIKTSG